MTYQVKLEAYEGPLDLLLDLISRQRVDVADISVALITEDFLKVVGELKDVDVDIASSFLILAATLLELKSLKLLPAKNTPDPDLALLLEERDHLIHRLIEFSTFKRAAFCLEELFSEADGFYKRKAALPRELTESVPVDLSNVTLARIVKAARKVLGKMPESVETSHITPIKVNLAAMVNLIAAEIEQTGHSTFRALCRKASGRLDIIVRFLALLELHKSDRVELNQDEPFGEIGVRWLERPDREGGSKGGSVPEERSDRGNRMRSPLGNEVAYE